MAEPILNLPGEIWKPVVGYEGFYEVSNMGRVKSLSRDRRSGKTGRYTTKEFLMGLSLDSKGRLTIGLSKSGVCKGGFVHTHVLRAFCGPRPSGCEACHNNGTPNDNRIENLRWDTSASNRRDAILHRRHVVGENSHKAKLTNAQAEEVRARRAAGETAESLGAIYGVTAASIRRIVSGETRYDADRAILAALEPQ